MNVGGDRDPPERMRMALCRNEIVGLGCAGQSEASDDARAVLRPQAGGGQALSGGLENGRKALLETEADIGGAGEAFSDGFARPIAQAGAASRAAAINAE
jgi:hypothetical protein